MSRINLDIDVLRTLVAAYQLGGFNRAAEQVAIGDQPADP
jgi:DNA-binding transcriptional LysR family regulator